MLEMFHDENENVIEIGVDEAGRGPLFGRVYTASVILPKDNSFNHSLMKDSKKFTSNKKILEAANYIKENALAWYVHYETENVIDNLNILQATQKSMHKAILETRKQYNYKMLRQHKYEKTDYTYNLLIDGNYFNTLTILNDTKTKLNTLSHICIKSGDNKYSSIAAASILAKVERDQYITDLCEEHPELNEKYKIGNNKGYGSKHHLDGIKEHGITEWHRKSFGICKKYKDN